VKKILFVCTANVCRSPMAQAIFDALAADGGLRFQAESAGTAALEEVGIYPGPHRARQVSEAMIEEAALVLAMSPRHAATLRRLSGESPAQILTLSEYATGVPDQEGVPDPYGLTMVAFRSTLRQHYEHVERAVVRLAGG
jgi:protein-tyrosine phosphatase